MTEQVVKPTLWEYVLINYPTEDGIKPAIINTPTLVLATTEAQVHKIAARAIPDHFIDRIEEVTIAVRPF